MKNIVSILAISLSLNSLAAQDVVVKGPDEKLQLVVFVLIPKGDFSSIAFPL